MSLPTPLPMASSTLFLLFLGRSWLACWTGRRARYADTIFERVCFLWVGEMPTKLVVSGAELCELGARGVVLLPPGHHQHPPALLLQVYDATLGLLPQVNF